MAHDDLSRRVIARHLEAGGSASVPGMTLESAKADYIAYIDDIISLGQKAKKELQSKEDPGLACGNLMGMLHDVRREDWYEFFYR